MVWYGIESEDVDVELRDLAPGPEGIGSRFRLEAGSESAEVSLPLHGLYNVENCLAAAACAWALGLSLDEIAEAVRDVRPASMRGVVHRGQRSRWWTTPTTPIPPRWQGAGGRRAAARASGGWRSWATCWSWVPRGRASIASRASWRRGSGFSPVLGVGELSRELVAGAGAGAEAHWVPDAAAAAEWAAREVREGDLVLVKASRGVGLDAVVRRLLPGAGGGALMLYHLLYPLRDVIPAFNVFRYITFRVAAAIVTALLLSWLLGPWFIRTLRRLSVGQNIRDVGPQAHQVKAGTPTMGGLLILFAALGRRCSGGTCQRLRLDRGPGHRGLRRDRLRRRLPQGAQAAEPGADGAAPSSAPDPGRRRSWARRCSGCPASTRT